MQGGWPMMDAGFCGDVQAVSASLPLNIIPALTKIYQLHLSYSSPSDLCSFLSLLHFLPCLSLKLRSHIFLLHIFVIFSLFPIFYPALPCTVALFFLSLSFKLFSCPSLYSSLPSFSPFISAQLPFFFSFYILFFSIVRHPSLLHLFFCSFPFLFSSCPTLQFFIFPYFISLQISFSFPLTQHLHHVLCLFSLFCRFSFLYKMFNMSVSKVRHLSFH